MIEELGEQRRARFEALAASAQGLRSSLESYRAEVLGGIPGGASEPVHLTFDVDGALERVDIDDAVRASLTAEELLTAFRQAFATAPLPRTVIAGLMSEPDRLRDIRASRRLPPATSVVGDDPRVALRARLGRPIELSMRRADILSMGSAELSAEVVRLARRAAQPPGTEAE